MKHWSLGKKSSFWSGIACFAMGSVDTLLCTLTDDHQYLIGFAILLPLLGALNLVIAIFED